MEVPMPIRSTGSLQLTGRESSILPMFEEQDEYGRGQLRKQQKFRQKMFM